MPFFFANSANSFSSFSLHAWLVGLQGLLNTIIFVLASTTLSSCSKSSFHLSSLFSFTTLEPYPSDLHVSSYAVQCGDRTIALSCLPKYNLISAYMPSFEPGVITIFFALHPCISAIFFLSSSSPAALPYLSLCSLSALYASFITIFGGCQSGSPTFSFTISFPCFSSA